MEEGKLRPENMLLGIWSYISNRESWSKIPESRTFLCSVVFHLPGM